MRHPLPAVLPLVEMLAWGGVSCVFWLVTLSSVTLPELCFAVGASIPCGVLAYAGRRALGASWRFRLRWLTWVLPVAVTLLAEVGVLWLIGVRPRRGRLTTIDLPDEEPRLSDGREAAAVLALCSTPGTIVADNDPQEHRLTVHRLLAAGPDLRSVVRR
jgi:multisubunit Na+/H+ antiporter MnhE subunit